MENHPIPQDITGFQFKLIGDMTIKQFAYLAFGTVIGWIIYSLSLNPLIKYPLIGVAAGTAAGLAFLPIAGRPMDTMIVNYFKAIFNPTQYLYSKMGGHLWLPAPLKSPKHVKIEGQKQKMEAEGKLSDFLNSLPKLSRNKLDEKERVYFETLSQMASPQPQTQERVKNTPVHIGIPQILQAANVIPESGPVKKQLNPEEESEESHYEEEELKKEAFILQMKLEEAKKLELSQTNSPGYQQAHQKVLELQKTLSDTLSQKQELEKQLISLQKQLSEAGKQVYRPSVAKAIEETQNIRSIPKGLGKGLGFPSTSEYPNIITGIVKDPRENPLPNILVEVKDKEGNPVRAFKTNALGHFASATPLINGTYRIEFEDQKNEHKFDVIEFSATGDVILPIEVISVDKREELRKSLFN